MLLKYVMLIILLSASLVAGNLLKEWNDYKLKYGKEYSLLDDARHKAVYFTNRNYINSHNLRFDRGCETYKLGINQFTDMNFKDYASLFQTSNRLLPPGSAYPPLGVCHNTKSTTTAWENFDWRVFGAVPEVRNQGLRCNAGWIFAALSAVQTGHFLSYTELPAQLSPQNLIDCVTPVDCQSKTPVEAYNYIIENQNVNTEQYYPYRGIPGSCRYRTTDIGATCAAHDSLSGNVNEVVNYVRRFGSVCVKIDPLSFTFMHYESGIYRPLATNTESAHYVTIIGFGNDPTSGNNYLIAQNSFGSTWGEAGFIRILADNNLVLPEVSFPIV